nr:TIGR02466 family protein [Sphingomicrobium nitratireducens]
MLFPTPVAAFEIKDFERINKQLLEEIEVRRKAEEGITRSNRAGWHSTLDFFQRPEPAHRELSQAILQAVAALTRRVAGQKDMLAKLKLECDGWVNVNPAGGYNIPHDHPGAFWSGAYYVKIPEALQKDENPSAGAIEFIDCRSAPTGQGLVKAKHFMGSIPMKPTEGTLLVFPSTQKHWVHPNSSEEERVTIAFNAKVVVNHAKMRAAAEEQLRGGYGQAQLPGGDKKPAVRKVDGRKKAPAKTK